MTNQEKWNFIVKEYYSTTTEEELIAILNSLFGQIMQEEAELIELYQKRFGNT